MRFSVVVVMCALSSFLAKAEIVSGTDTLKLTFGTSNGVSFDSHTVLGIVAQNSNLPCALACTTNVQGMDIFDFFSEYTTCACPCTQAGEIGSPRPFYRSKKSFDSMDLNVQLNLADTEKFAKVDTFIADTDRTHNPPYQHCTDICNLPFVRIPRGNVDSVYVISTSSGKYALVRVRPTDDSVYSDCLVIWKWFTYLEGYAVTWYLQEDGSLDFSGITATGRKLPIQRGKTEFAKRCRIVLKGRRDHGGAENVYTIRGERLRGVNASEEGKLAILIR